MVECFNSSTCDGDPEMLREKWVSILRHTVNKHKWNDHHVFHQCGHPKMSTRERISIKWLDAGSPSHVALEEVVTNNKLLNDLAMLTEFHHTGELEQYHSLMLKYLPKREHFSFKGMRYLELNLPPSITTGMSTETKQWLKRELLKERKGLMLFAPNRGRIG